MRLKLIHDDPYRAPRVVNVETGEEIEGVMEIEYTWQRQHREPPILRLTLAGVEAEAEATMAPYNPHYVY